MSDDSTAPITHEYLLGCRAEEAFATYTGRISEWWDPRYTANAETLEAVTIEPRVGGGAMPPTAVSGGTIGVRSPSGSQGSGSCTRLRWLRIRSIRAK